VTENKNKPLEKILDSIKNFFEKITVLFQKKVVNKFFHEKNSEQNSDIVNNEINNNKSDNNQKQKDETFIKTFGKEKEKIEKKEGLLSGIIKSSEELSGKKDNVLEKELSEEDSKEKTEQEKKKEIRNKSLLVIFKFSTFFSLLFPLFSWILFQTILNPESNFSEFFKTENFGKTLENLKNDNQEKEKTFKTISENIKNIEQKIEEIKNNKLVAQISESRIDFLEIMFEINDLSMKAIGVTPVINLATKMIVFDSYSATLSKDGDGAEIKISGKLRDPQGRSFHKITKLIETFNEDPNFELQDMIRSFSKNKSDIGGTESGFAFNFKYGSSKKK